MFDRVPLYFHQENAIIIIVKEITTNAVKLMAIVKYIKTTNSSNDHSSKKSKNKGNVNNTFLINNFKDLLKDTNVKSLDFIIQKNYLKIKYLGHLI